MVHHRPPVPAGLLKTLHKLLRRSCYRKGHDKRQPSAKICFMDLASRHSEVSLITHQRANPCSDVRHDKAGDNYAATHGVLRQPCTTAHSRRDGPSRRRLCSTYHKTEPHSSNMEHTKTGDPQKATDLRQIPTQNLRHLQHYVSASQTDITTMQIEIRQNNQSIGRASSTDLRNTSVSDSPVRSCIHERCGAQRQAQTLPFARPLCLKFEMARNAARGSDGKIAKIPTGRSPSMECATATKLPFFSYSGTSILRFPTHTSALCSLTYCGRLSGDWTSVYIAAEITTIYSRAHLTGSQDAWSRTVEGF